MLNKCMIIGNLGADPEMRYTANGTPVTSFRVATSRQYGGSDGERHEETEWFSVVTWARLAETCSQYLSKGRQVYVEGRLRSRSYEGRDGQTRFVNEINLTDVQFLSRPQGVGGDESAYGFDGGDGGRGGPGEDGPPTDDVDDLPF